MADDLRALEDWAGALLAKLEPKQRRQLNQGIARKLRRSQQQRIAAQRNPDGTPYAPRKARQPLRSKQGRVKQKMFTKLRQARYLKLQSDANTIALSFLARTARLARVHQYGLRDRPGRNSPDVQYSRRELLGFAAADLEMIRDELLDQLAR
ncbi:phage virion morphogenesis protein [Ectopseudomonas mendocina]|uniref:phage virion morphogenesis protein n=1 Tax=Ectopseudomonas mendocina TaxID=300 RepID=UPI000206DF49|nr:phage virion morphogenesis protein [Pseudomonas mendocina]AEB58219.1 phage P2 essential tail completion gpS-like protein [Pseudomonas mendocina NK-01]